MSHAYTNMYRVFNFHGSMHHHIYFELIKTSLMQLFSILLHFFFALHVSDVTHIHPQEHPYVHAGGTRKCTCGDLFPGASSPN